MPDREKVIECLQKAKMVIEAWVPMFEQYNTPAGIDDALALLQEQEVVLAHWDDDTGHWIEGDRNGIDPHTRTTGEMIDTYRCSWCGFYQYWKTPFCPNCGAKMEGR